jgi:hypothetical protein
MQHTQQKQEPEVKKPPSLLEEIGGSHVIILGIFGFLYFATFVYWSFSGKNHKLSALSDTLTASLVLYLIVRFLADKISAKK